MQAPVGRKPGHLGSAHREKVEVEGAQPNNVRVVERVLAAVSAVREAIAAAIP